MAKSKETRIHTETRGLVYLTLSIILALSLCSFEQKAPEINWLGLLGYTFAWLLTYFFGVLAYPLLALSSWIGFRHLAAKPIDKSRVTYILLFFFSVGILLNLLAELGSPIPSCIKSIIYKESLSFEFPYPHRTYRYNVAGVPLYFIYRDLFGFNLQKLLSDMGIAITFTTLSIVFFSFASQIRLYPIVELFLKKCSSLKEWTLEKQSAPIEEEILSPPEEIELLPPLRRPIYAPPALTKNKEEEKREIPSLSPPQKPALFSRKQEVIEEQKLLNGDLSGYKLPPLSLLNNPKKVDQPMLKKDLRRQADILEETLMSFGIEGKVGDIHSGPTITSFEIQPAVGVKVQKITALESDIALNLQAKAIRMIAPIPGKAAVGVEIPSPYPQEVSFKELLQNYQNSAKKCTIPVLLGKTVTGENVVSDLTKMPHAIIAGATGSGKSVCINTIIISILMNARPDEVKMLMIDPKKVELTSYTHLPHLIAPVITEPHGAYAALNWLVKEMQSRYDILKHLALRNIAAFNHRTINKELETSLNIPIPDKMPMIVAIIDEFADLMMVSSSDLETPIARIAQMARAVGIHLILATQRPSREVITGLIKANFPVRIAFKVASRINSQIILDENGAESLLGNGDMLFLPPGSSHLVRAQGAYISDEEIHKIVDFICQRTAPNYLIPSFDSMRKEDGGAADEGSSRDSLFDQAKNLVIETNTASTTFLQRKLKIGYARAASLIDELEMRSIIGPQEGARPRRVLCNQNSQGNEHKRSEYEKDLFNT